MTDQQEEIAQSKQFAPGDVIDGTYEVLRLIGQGAAGYVYQVKHLAMDRNYALKALDTRTVTPSIWKRFQNEAQIISRINHANIVSIYNFGLHDGTIADNGGNRAAVRLPPWQPMMAMRTATDDAT